jgi:hypothetical protein
VDDDDVVVVVVVDGDKNRNYCLLFHFVVL